MYKIEKFTTLAYNTPFLIEIDKTSCRELSRREYLYKCKVYGVEKNILFSLNMKNRIESINGDTLYLFSHASCGIYDGSVSCIDYFRHKVLYSFVSKEKFDSLVKEYKSA